MSEQKSSKREELEVADSEISASMALGVILQPATAKSTGRLRGTLQSRVDEVFGACAKVLNT